MTLGPRDLVVLDTSVLIHLARNDATGQAMQRLFNLSTRAERPLISSVTRGEARAMAIWRSWGQTRLAQLDALFDEMVTVDTGRAEVIAAYARLHALSRTSGRPIGDNDLWIAATCVAAQAQLITNDTDFDWLHPGQITRHYVKQALG